MVCGSDSSGFVDGRQQSGESVLSRSLVILDELLRLMQNRLIHTSDSLYLKNMFKISLIKN